MTNCKMCGRDKRLLSEPSVDICPQCVQVLKEVDDQVLADSNGESMYIIWAPEAGIVCVNCGAELSPGILFCCDEPGKTKCLDTKACIKSAVLQNKARYYARMVD